MAAETRARLIYSTYYTAPASSHPRSCPISQLFLKPDSVRASLWPWRPLLHRCPRCRRPMIPLRQRGEEPGSSRHRAQQQQPLAPLIARLIPLTLSSFAADQQFAQPQPCFWLIFFQIMQEKISHSASASI